MLSKNTLTPLPFFIRIPPFQFSAFFGFRFAEMKLFVLLSAALFVCSVALDDNEHAALHKFAEQFGQSTADGIYSCEQKTWFNCTSDGHVQRVCP